MAATPAFAVELFRYRGAAKDGGTLEYVFEAGEQNSTNAVTKEKAAETAADFMTTFYHAQVGALETQEFPTATGTSGCRQTRQGQPRHGRSAAGINLRLVGQV